MKPLKSTLRIDPHLPLQAVPLFWLSIALPALASITLIVLALPDIGAACFSPDCYSGFLSQFQLPIGVLSLSLVFGVMVGRFHGSAQRVAVYEQNQANNTLRSYFDHRKYFHEWLVTLHGKQIEAFKYIHLDSSARLYSRLFEDNSPAKVSTTLTPDKVRSIYRDIELSMISTLNFFWTNQLANNENPTYTLTPEGAFQEINEAMVKISRAAHKYGITIKNMKDWPRPHHQTRYEIVSILTEIAQTLTLAHEFANSDTHLKLMPSPAMLELIQEDAVQGYINLALTFGCDAEPNNS